MPEVWEADTVQRLGEKLLELLFPPERPEARDARKKEVVRQAWDGHPDHGGTMYVEVPPGIWVPAEPFHYEHFDVRLDPDACDPDPQDMEDRCTCSV